MLKNKIYSKMNLEEATQEEKAYSDACSGITQRLLEKYKPSLNDKYLNSRERSNREKRAA